MSKSYFERRIFGQTDPDHQADQTDAAQDQTPSLGSLKASKPSQPYRFRAARSGDHPPIAAAHITDPDTAPAPQEWEASPELRNRLGMSAEEEIAHGPEQEQPDLQPEDYGTYVAEQERLMDDITGHAPMQQAQAQPPHARAEDEPYPLGAPQPSMPAEEPSFGFHGGDAPDAAFQAAPVATTATHAVGQTAAPESAVTEPRMASASAVRVGERVNLSDQRAGSSVQPNLYVSADDRIGGPAAPAPAVAPATAPRGPKPPLRNPLSGAAAVRTSQQQRRSANPPAVARKPMQAGTGAMPPRRPRRREEGGPIAFLRKGAVAIAMLFGVGLLMSVSYAALQGLRSTSEPGDIPVLLAPQTPVKFTPEEAGIDPDTAEGRVFEPDLLVLNSPQGVLEPSDNRYAASADSTPTMTMDFGGTAVLLPQIDTAQPAVLVDPMRELAVAPDPVEPPVAPGLADPAVIEPIPAIEEEPLADLRPLANGLSDVAIPKTRGSVPLSYEGLVVKVQAQQTPPLLAPSANAGAEVALVQSTSSGQATASIDPAAGLANIPQAPGLTGTAVVTPFGIQLASLRTEQQAAVLWKRLQDKYPSLLGGLSFRVVQYDSGARGIFYRLQAGPMPNKTTAVDYCVKLKRAGQECFFVRG